MIFEIEVDLCPERDLMDYIADRKARTPELNVGWLLTSVLKEKLAAYVLARSEIDTAKTIGELTEGGMPYHLCSGAWAGVSTHRGPGMEGRRSAQTGGVVLAELDEITGEPSFARGWSTSPGNCEMSNARPARRRQFA